MGGYWIVMEKRTGPIHWTILLLLTALMQQLIYFALLIIQHSQVVDILYTAGTAHGNLS